MEWRVDRDWMDLVTGNGRSIPWTPGAVRWVAQLTCNGDVVNDADVASEWTPASVNTIVVTFLAPGQPDVAQVVFTKNPRKASGAPLVGEQTYGATINVSADMFDTYWALVSSALPLFCRMDPSDPSVTQLILKSSASYVGGKKPPKKKPRKRWKKPLIPKPGKPGRPPKKRGKKSSR